MAGRLAACLLNVSEARNYQVVKKIAEEAVRNQKNWKPDLSLLEKKGDEKENATSTRLPKNLVVGGDGVSSSDNAFCFKCNATVLNIFADIEYNRSVITLAAPIEFLGECLFQACDEAFRQIDLRNQEGGHPRLGAVDLIPIHPLSKNVSLSDCGKVAIKLAEKLSKQSPGTAMFFFGAADIPENRGLVRRRKDMNWYAGRHSSHREYLETKCWDIGDHYDGRFGITGVGAIPYMTNFNVTIDTSDMATGNFIAKAIRATSPDGLFGVQSMAFHHDGMIEIACNVDTHDLQKQVRMFATKDTYTGQPCATFEEIQNKISVLCALKQIKMHASAIIGFTPHQAYDKAVEFLEKGDVFQPMKFNNRRM